MNISITFRQMEGTEAMKHHATDKVSKLQKFLRQAMTAHVTLTVEGLEHIADVRIQSGSHTFHAAERRQDMYASLDMVIDKLERQIQHAKGVEVSKKHGGMSASEFAMEVERESQRGTRG